ncbi:conserved membrane hypothetical protein [Gammaproteobacteria bacterium]
MAYTGLALEQAPPLQVPLRFFLTAPLFGVIAVLAAAATGALDHRWTSSLLAVTHLFTLGCLAMVMMGAMMQMLPVVAGTPVVQPLRVSATLHALLTGGVILLAAGLAGVHSVLPLGLGLLAGAIALFLIAAGWSLIRAPGAPDTVQAMRLALISLALTAGLGLWLGAGHAYPTLGLRRDLTDLHLIWGGVGWIGLLVVGVAYQVVPMFQMTLPYPQFLRRALAPLLFLGLAMASIPYLAAGPAAQWLGVMGIALLWAGLATFAVTTLVLQARRRRRVSDATLWHWRIAMGMLLATLVLWAAGQAWPALHYHRVWSLLLGVLYLQGFTLGVMTGMLYKILPFLVWFHLQARLLAQGAGPTQVRVPHMREVIPDRQARRQLLIHVVALVLTVGAVLWPNPQSWVVSLSLCSLAFSCLWLSRDLWGAARRYREILRRMDEA